MVLKNLNSHPRCALLHDEASAKVFESKIQGRARDTIGMMLSFALCLTGSRDQVAGRREGVVSTADVWMRVFEIFSACLNSARPFVKVSIQNFWQQT